MGAMTKVPEGTSTVPPFLGAAQASIASWKAAVSLVVPSPSAPNFLTSQTLVAARAGRADRLAMIIPSANLVALPILILILIFIAAPFAPRRSEHTILMVVPISTG
jgi:hypothetical protein